MRAPGYQNSSSGIGHEDFPGLANFSELCENADSAKLETWRVDAALEMWAI